VGCSDWKTFDNSLAPVVFSWRMMLRRQLRNMPMQSLSEAA
jgi:hypothetical protein